MIAILWFQSQVIMPTLFFFSGFGGCCTKEYEDVGLEMVRKCERLPLAIVALVVFYIANAKVHLNGQV